MGTDTDTTTNSPSRLAYDHHRHHSSSSSPSLSRPPSFTTTICTEADVVEDTTTITLHLFHSVLYCTVLVVGVARCGGGVGGGMGRNGVRVVK